jgi:hypothetical protein
MSALRDKIYAMLQKSNDFSKHESRINKELDFFEDIGVLNDLFVIFQKISDHKENPGDKNIINSYVAFALGITTALPDFSKPVNLEKRRTYGRAGFPDIDMDFDYAKRHLIVEYLFQKYGREYVSNIGTRQTLKIKAALRRVIKVLDPTNSIVFDKDGKQAKQDTNMNFQFENELLQTLPKFMKKDDGNIVSDIADAYNTYPEFRKYMDKYPRVYEVSKRLQGSISGMGCLSKDTLVLTSLGWTRIDQISSDAFKVAFLDGQKNVQYTNNYIPHKTGRKKCYKLKLKNGDYIKVTDEHLIFTDKGCVAFLEIRKNPEKYKIMCINCHNIHPAACNVTQEINI